MLFDAIAKGQADQGTPFGLQNLLHFHSPQFIIKTSNVFSRRTQKKEFESFLIGKERRSIMKKITVISALLVMSMVVSFPSRGVIAADCRCLLIGVKGGLYMPMGDHMDFADKGFTVGAEISLPLNDNVTVGLSMSYNNTDISKTISGWAPEEFEVDGDIKMIEMLLYADYNITPSIFFLRGCAGINLWEADADGGYTENFSGGWDYKKTIDVNGTDFMMAVGGGLNLTERLQAVVLFNRVFADILSDKDADYVNITLGYKF